MRRDQQPTSGDQFRRRQAPQRGGRHDWIPDTDQSSEVRQNKDGLTEPDELDTVNVIEESRASSASAADEPTSQATEGKRDR
jgi:hypothetical protein